MAAYRWIATLSGDRPVDAALIQDIHTRMVEGADDDHCPPGVLRTYDQNVNFGSPRHRGAEGGEEVRRAFEQLVSALRREYHDHDPIVQAISAHYHVAAMHPFLDGNGRTARALEALLLGRAGLRDTAFIAMSNYYYDEKQGYLAALAETRALGHDLTPFLKFALKGVAVQGGRLLREIRLELQKELFRNRMYELFKRLKSKRKRVIGERQIEILKVLLDSGPTTSSALFDKVYPYYSSLQNPAIAMGRDVWSLMHIQAIDMESVAREGNSERVFRARLEWPTEITDTEFFARIQNMPKGKTYSFLR